MLSPSRLIVLSLALPRHPSHQSIQLLHLPYMDAHLDAHLFLSLIKSVKYIYFCSSVQPYSFMMHLLAFSKHHRLCMDRDFDVSLTP